MQISKLGAWCVGNRRPSLSTRRRLIVAPAFDAESFQIVGLTNAEGATVLATNPAIFSDVEKEQIAENLTFLGKTFKPKLSAKLILRQPELLAAVALEEWHSFLTGYGLDDEAAWRVFRYCPALLLGTAGPDSEARPNTPYRAGAAIMFLKSYGWTDADIASRVLPCYPQVLAATPEELKASIDFLRSRQFSEEAIQRLVLTFPPLLVGPLREDLFPLIDRIRASAHNKYVVSGSYHV